MKAHVRLLLPCARSSAFGVLLLLAVAASPPRCAPIPLGPGAHPDCVQRNCPPGGACRIDWSAHDGLPCGDGWGICDGGVCVCAPRCDGRACGPDGCTGSCGECGAAAFCSAGECVPEGVGPGPHMQVVASLPGISGPLALTDDFVLVGWGDSLTVREKRPDGPPVELGRVALPQPPGAPLVVDDVVYVDAGALHAIDISDPTRPRVLARHELPHATEGHVQRILRAGDFVYIGSRGFRPDRVDIYQMLGPGQLEYRSSYEPEGASALEKGMATDGRYLYLASDDGVGIYDLEDPLRPRPTGQIVACPALSGPAQPERFWDVRVDAGRLYVACRDGIQITDIRDPERPRSLGVAIDGYFYWTSHSFPVQVAIHGDFLYASGFGSVGLAMWDISDPAAPALRAEYFEHCGRGTDFKCWAGGVAADDDRVYLAYHGLMGLPAVPPEDAPLAPDWVLFGAGTVSALLPQGKRLVAVGAEPPVSAWDISGLLAGDAEARPPRLTHTYWDPPIASHVAPAAAVDGDLVYVISIAGQPSGDATLLVLRLEPEGQTRLVGTAALPGVTAPADVGGAYPIAELRGSILGIVSGGAVILVDVADPGHPLVVGRASRPGSGGVLQLAATAEGFVATCDRGVIWLADVSDPANPVVRDLWRTNDELIAGAYHDGLAFLVRRYEGHLFALDLRDERTPLSYAREDDYVWAEAPGPRLRLAPPFAYVLGARRPAAGGEFDYDTLTVFRLPETETIVLGGFQHPWVSGMQSGVALPRPFGRMLAYATGERGLVLGPAEAGALPQGP